VICIVGQINDSVSFTNSGSPMTNTNSTATEASVVLVVKGSSGMNKLHILCYKCKNQRHYANDCPDTDTSSQSGTGKQATGTTMLMAGLARGEFDQCDGFHFLNNHLKQVTSTWLLLDDQSIVDVFNNASVLKNIHKSTTTMNIHCNARIVSKSMLGDLPGYGTVWYHPEGITNILSLAHIIEKEYHITFDSKDGDNKFIVNKPNGGTPHIFT